LELEITENIILKHDDVVLAPLQQLRADGVGIAFDDFGTGYASLSMLKRYPITRLKIDQSFVRNLCDSVQDASIIRAVVHMAKAFGLEVIAEGVETEEQMRRLLRKGCDELQGFMFGRPAPAQEFTAMLLRQQLSTPKVDAA
jgi:EAL domain-containing protein (putative c-di-GMP-specific phosphodiesterase class I)